MRRCNDVSKVQRLYEDQVSPEVSTPQQSVHPMVPEVAAAVSERPTATSERRVTKRTDALCTGSSDAYGGNWLTASNGSLDLEAYIYASPRPF